MSLAPITWKKLTKKWVIRLYVGTKLFDCGLEAQIPVSVSVACAVFAVVSNNWGVFRLIDDVNCWCCCLLQLLNYLTWSGHASSQAVIGPALSDTLPTADLSESTDQAKVIGRLVMPVMGTLHALYPHFASVKAALDDDGRGVAVYLAANYQFSIEPILEAKSRSWLQQQSIGSRLTTEAETSKNGCASVVCQVQTGAPAVAVFSGSAC